MPVDAFTRFAALLTVEDGSPLVIEPWQRDVVADLLGAKEAVVSVAKGNGKTSLLAALGLFHLVTTPTAAAYAAASSRDQATLLFNAAAGFIRRSPALQRHFNVKPGYRHIRSRRDSGFLQVLSADADRADGVAPTLCLVDELHRHKDRGALYAVLRDGLPKRDGAVWTISTAGWDEDSPLGRLRSRALSLPDVTRQGAHVVARADRFVWHEWSVPDDADAEDMAAVKEANPLATITVESLRARHESPSMREMVWRRFTCNQWVRTEQEAWVTASPWDACADASRQVAKGTAIVLALDGSYNGDTTALVGSTIDRPHLFVAGLWEPADGTTVPMLEVEDRIGELCRTFAVKEVAADPYRWQRSLEVLAAKRLPVETFPQSPSRMVPATSRLFDAIVNQGVTHDGDEALRRHVLSAVVRDRGHGLMIAKESRKSGRRIDLAVAAVMAYDRAHHHSAGARRFVWGAAEVFGPSDEPIDAIRERARRDGEEAVAGLARMLGVTPEEVLADGD